MPLMGMTTEELLDPKSLSEVLAEHRGHLRDGSPLKAGTVQALSSRSGGDVGWVGRTGLLIMWVLIFSRSPV